jgi:hypothetical protein
VPIKLDEKPARKTAAKTTKPPSLGALIDQMHSLREKKRELEASVKDLGRVLGLHPQDEVRPPHPTSCL